MFFHYERGFRRPRALQKWQWITTGQIQTHQWVLVRCARAHAPVCVGPPLCSVRICAYGITQAALVCLYLAGCEKRQRLGESCREALQGLERMLIKASYSTASSFLTVPAAGSTTLRFLTTSSPLSLSALLYFCLPLLLSPSPSVSHLLPFAQSSTSYLKAQTADVFYVE